MVKRIGLLKVVSAIVAASLNAFLLTAQVTIDECIRMAKKNYPQYRQHELTDLEEGYNQRNNSLKCAPCHFRESTIF